ncbi:nucleotide exchange factor GrpE [Thermoflexibacter ruber]|uniref:Protein GrpE n=1 Tax=Thermoflexibacter ruber TaxID=1003 RepID=A0A1I2FB16_9BACT|nr:nucleotide exchange factor GrpE [Thermoflexibacter ruber]SFF02582.1 molecular chaperone GrpE [Thermoflexibacter ruber]
MENHNDDTIKDQTNNQEVENVTIEEVSADTQQENQQEVKVHNTENEAEKWKKEFAEMKEKYVRLYADFENYRKRTAKEKLDFMTTANEGLMVSLLPVLDDFERAQKNFDNQDIESLKQGMVLIHDKLFKILEQKGLKPMVDVKGSDFNADYHEAITQIPMPEMQGKVVDELEKGYFLGEKVVRYAKVVVGS